MAIVTDGSASSGWQIDSTAKAGRATLYDSAGNEVGKPATSAYCARFSIRQSAATAAASSVWTMRNLSGNSTNVRIRSIRGQHVFDGTAAASTALYGFYRFTTATPTGGSTVTASKKLTSYGSTVVTDIRFVDTGLTMTSVVLETDPFMVSANPRGATASTTYFEVNFATPSLEKSAAFVLLNGEGISLRLVNTAVVGDGIYGAIEWDEGAF